jgi:hypothetical protein
MSHGQRKNEQNTSHQPKIRVDYLILVPPTSEKLSLSFNKTMLLSLQQSIMLLQQLTNTVFFKDCDFSCYFSTFSVGSENVQL